MISVLNRRPEEKKPEEVRMITMDMLVSSSVWRVPVQSWFINHRTATLGTITAIDVPFWKILEDHDLFFAVFFYMCSSISIWCTKKGVIWQVIETPFITWIPTMCSSVFFSLKWHFRLAPSITERVPKRDLWSPRIRERTTQEGPPVIRCFIIFTAS